MGRGQVRSTYRHRLPVRLAHWTNVLCLFILLMSGLQIFNAHPALYWGKISTFDKPALSLTAQRGSDGKLHGITQVGSFSFESTGWLGASANMRGELSRRAFPTWATIPGAKSLASARLWHFFFAWIFVINGMLFLLWAWRSRHLARDLWPTGADWRGIGHSIVEHLKFRHPTGEAATRYNILQKLAYLGVILVLVPGVILMGLAMSPHLDSILGWLLDLVGGRQSARSLHFVCAMALLAFIAIHVFMVLVSGPVNQLRSMITGRYDIPLDPAPAKAGDEAAKERGHD